MALWFSIGISAIIPISVIEQFESFPVLVPIFYVSLILRKRRLDESFSFWFVVLPRARVKLFPRLPFPLPMLHSIHKTAMIDILVAPNKDAILVFRLIVDKFPDEDIAIDVFQPISVLAVVLEVSLVEAKIVLLVDEQAVAMIKLVADISEVEGGHAFVEEQFAELLELRYCHFLEEVIGVVDQDIVGFLLVPEEFLD